LVFELKGDRHRTFIVEKNVQWKSAKTITWISWTHISDFSSEEDHCHR
jgi:hypothetical protein